jgi:hypothetical protein
MSHNRRIAVTNLTTAKYIMIPVLQIPKFTGFRKYSLSHKSTLTADFGLDLKLSAKTFQKQLFAHSVVFALGKIFRREHIRIIESGSNRIIILGMRNEQ